MTFYPLRNPKQFCFQGLAGKKTLPLPHDFFSCYEIRNKDIFKAGHRLTFNPYTYTDMGEFSKLGVLPNCAPIFFKLF